jgi:AcrR family transcriptional regulator
MTSSSKKPAPRAKPKKVRSKVQTVRTGPVSYQEALERRNRVIEVAGQEFLTHGFHGTSIDTIAEKSRVSKVTIYRECGNKETIFQEFFLVSLSEFRYNLDHLLHSGDPIEKIIHDTIKLIIDTNSDARAFSLLTLAIAERARFPHVARRVLDQAFEVARSLGDYLRANVGDTTLTREEASQRAFHLLNMALGGSGVLLDDPNTFYGDREKWVDSVAATFIDGLASWRK